LNQDDFLPFLTFDLVELDLLLVELLDFFLAIIITSYLLASYEENGLEFFSWKCFVMP
jgi:hypothetical protein